MLINLVNHQQFSKMFKALLMQITIHSQSTFCAVQVLILEVCLWFFVLEFVFESLSFTFDCNSNAKKPQKCSWGGQIHSTWMKLRIRHKTTNRKSVGTTDNIGCFNIWLLIFFQTEDYQAKKRQSKELRRKLFHIKHLVKIYDQGFC